MEKYDLEYVHVIILAKNLKYKMEKELQKNIIIIIQCHDILMKFGFKNGEKNGKAEERYCMCCLWDRADFIFEGEYLNGKKWNGIFKVQIEKLLNQNYELKNGRGLAIEINNDRFYEGDFVDGEKNGKGTEFILENWNYNWDNRILLFEGEYLNGKRNGKGKEYNKLGQLKFEGEYKFGFKAEGKEYYNNGKLYFQGKYNFGEKYSGEGYDQNGKIIFKINNGKGFIKEYANDRERYHRLDDDEYLKFEG